MKVTYLLAAHRLTGRSGGQNCWQVKRPLLPDCCHWIDKLKGSIAGNLGVQHFAQKDVGAWLLAIQVVFSMLPFAKKSQICGDGVGVVSNWPSFDLGLRFAYASASASAHTLTHTPASVHAPSPACFRTRSRLISLSHFEWCS